MPNISIIVPIYNVEAYLQRCLESISGQTMGDFEVICVDDGSTDGSADIVRRKMQEDARFKLVSKENGGLSSARNCGIEHATGEIIVFVDADDYITRDCCERIVQAFASRDAQIVIFGISIKSATPVSPWYDRVCSPPDMVFDEFSDQLMFADYATPFVVRNAIKRDFLCETGIRFDENLRFGEDVVIQFAMFPRAKRVISISDKLYCYDIDREDSLCHTKDEDQKRLAAHRDVIEAVFADWSSLGLLHKYARQLFIWSKPFVLRGIESLDSAWRLDHLRLVANIWKRYFTVETAVESADSPFEAALMRALFSNEFDQPVVNRALRRPLWELERASLSPHELKPLHVKSSTLCRGDGKMYAACVFDEGVDASNLECVASAGGIYVPTHVYPLTQRGDTVSNRAVLEMPLLDVKSLEVALRPQGDPSRQCEIAFNYRQARWSSRLNYRLKARQCAEIRDYERSWNFGRYQITPTSRFGKDEQAIWRLVVRWVGDEGHKPSLLVSDACGLPIGFRCWNMEFQPASRDSELSEHVLYVSVELPASLRHFVVEAYDACAEESIGGLGSGFSVVDEGIATSLEEAAARRMKTASDDDAAYRDWFDAHRSGEGVLRAQREFPMNGVPSFSVVVEWDGADAGLLESTIESLARQTLPARQVIVLAERADTPQSPKALQGKGIAGAPIICKTQNGEAGVYSIAASADSDYVAFVEAGDVLEPDALYEYSRCAQAGVEGDALPEALYCDEDVMKQDGSLTSPLFKSRFDLDSLYCGNWVGNMLAVRKGVIASLGQPDEAACEDVRYDLALRVYEMGGSYRHVPRVLYHARRSPFLCDGAAMNVRRSILENHLVRREVPCDVVEAEVPGALRIRYKLPEPAPLVSIIIPSKDHTDLLDACIQSIVGKSTYPEYEIIVVENNSVEAQTFEYYESLVEEFDCVDVVKWPHEFNYSKIINFGARHARGSHLLFLNNDTEVVDPAFLEEMVGCLQRPEVGVVGARLLFRDGLLQHAGSGVGIGGAIACMNQNRCVEDGGYLQKARLTGNYCAVGGACQMTRADVFEQLGGYNESLGVAFNDIDYCMRAWANGYLVVYTPYATLYHYEFASRGREDHDAAKMLRWQRERGQFMQAWPEPFAEGDPFIGPNLDQRDAYYGLSYGV